MSRITHDICDSLGIDRPRPLEPNPIAKQQPHYVNGAAVLAADLRATRSIVLAGGTGFLGGLLARHFIRAGWRVVVLTRSRCQPFPGETGPAGKVTWRQWDGRTIGPWADCLEGAEAVINLAGRSVNCRYHARNRKEMLESRVASTRVLGEAIARLTRPPRVWMNLSTATIYRHTLGPPWDESGEIGATVEAKDAFSIEVARAWEAAFAAAFVPRTRKIVLRSAMVFGLSSDANNVYRVLRRLVRWGLGGRMGSGRQFVSWIHETDFCRAVEFIVGVPEMEGAVNLAAPGPLSNAEMMATLRRVLGRPYGLPANRWMLELGAFLLRTETELIIKSRRVVSRRLSEAGFRFRFERLEDAIRDLESRLPGSNSSSFLNLACARMRL